MKYVLNVQWVIILGVFLVFPIAFFSCSEDEGDDEPQVEPLVGKYTFRSATFENEITIKINGQDITFPAGGDATSYVAGGLFGAAPCNDPNNAALELRENGQGFFVCIGETNEIQGGRWEVNDERTQITLFITNPAPVTVLIENFTLANSILSGRVSNFPLVKDTQYSIGSPLPGGGLNLQTTPVAIELNKVD